MKIPRNLKRLTQENIKNAHLESFGGTPKSDKTYSNSSASTRPSATTVNSKHCRNVRTNYNT